MLVKRYFFIQNLSFVLSGIDIRAQNYDQIIKRPWLCYIPLTVAIGQIVPVLHYTLENWDNFINVADSISCLLQSLLGIWKMLIFLSKRKKFLKIVNEIHSKNFLANKKELSIIRLENSRNDAICTTYFSAVFAALIWNYINPIIEAIYKYLTTSELSLRIPYKASYFWNHNKIPGYSLVYILSFITSYQLLAISLAIDTLFTWIISNIAAQFQILCLHFQEADKRNDEIPLNYEEGRILNNIKSCIRAHNRLLKLIRQFNEIYGEIIFVKFIISCSQICSLAFLLSYHSQSASEMVFQLLFMSAVVIQMILYCYHGQRLQEESLKVCHRIYMAFEWSQLPKSCKKILLLPMMRSQIACQVKEVFFVVDLRLFLWVFKSAGSLIAALKSLNENRT